MIGYNKLVQYAESFLIAEIRAIEKILENENIEYGVKKTLSRLLYEYKMDLEKIEEVDRIVLTNILNNEWEVQVGN